MPSLPPAEEEELRVKLTPCNDQPGATENELPAHRKWLPVEVMFKTHPTAPPAWWGWWSRSSARWGRGSRQRPEWWWTRCAPCSPPLETKHLTLNGSFILSIIRKKFSGLFSWFLSSFVSFSLPSLFFLHSLLSSFVLPVPNPFSLLPFPIIPSMLPFPEWALPCEVQTLLLCLRVSCHAEWRSPWLAITSFIPLPAMVWMKLK